MSVLTESRLNEIRAVLAVDRDACADIARELLAAYERSHGALESILGYITSADVQMSGKTRWRFCAGTQHEVAEIVIAATAPEPPHGH